MRKRFAARVASHRHLHQACIHGVLEVSLENAIFDQCGALGGVALVIDVERTAAASDGAVVYHGYAPGGDALAESAGESTLSLAVEIAFETVADRFMQQD